MSLHGLEPYDLKEINQCNLGNTEVKDWQSFDSQCILYLTNGQTDGPILHLVPPMISLGWPPCLINS